MIRKTMYICRRDFEGGRCPIDDYPCYEECFMTTHPEMAKNGPCDDPENHPERFKAVAIDDGVRYEERSDHSGESGELT